MEALTHARTSSHTCTQNAWVPQEQQRQKGPEEKKKKRSRSKIIRHALDTTHLSRQTEHPHITLGSRTVTRAHLPWQHFLGHRVGTWAVKRGENKEICWRTYCVRLGPPNWVPPSTHMPHKCDLWTLAGAQHAGPWHRLKLKLPCCRSVKMQKTTG